MKYKRDDKTMINSALIPVNSDSNSYFTLKDATVKIDMGDIFIIVTAKDN